MKIMFICTGNICRSAMAEGMMKKLVQENNLNIEVYSCGTYAETGDYSTYNAVEVSKKYGVDISNHRATNIRESKIEEMDLILCMTNSHKQMVSYMYPNLKEKIYTIKEYVKMDKQSQELDIKDPWGFDINVYEKCIEEIKECLDKIIETLKNK